MQERIIANSVMSTTSFYEGTPCWEWIGKSITNRSGQRYGRITTTIKGEHVSVLVHRLVLMVFRGRTINRSQVAMHKCNNSICCNPMHIAGGTQSKNMKQCVADGRHRWQQASAA